MGFFSWKTSDTDRSISNVYSEREPFPVYVLIPAEFGGGHIEEKQYEGYGRFGGRDVYALAAQWNCPELCVGNDNMDRDIGIEIACTDKQNARLKYPIKIVENGAMSYEEAAASSECPYQGYFYEEDTKEWYRGSEKEEEHIPDAVSEGKEEIAVNRRNQKSR